MAVVPRKKLTVFTSHSLDGKCWRTIYYTQLVIYLKKSERQKSLPSREKHFSARCEPQSVHVTQAVCHGLSKTFNKNLSVIGRSQPAQACVCTIADEALPTPIATAAATVRPAAWLTTLSGEEPRSFAAKWSPASKCSAGVSSARWWGPKLLPSEPGRAAADSVTAVLNDKQKSNVKNVQKLKKYPRICEIIQVYS